MEAERVWRLQHVWPKDMPDLTTVNLSDFNDAEVRQVVEQVEDVKRAFESFVADYVMAHISQTPTRVGVIESLRLFTSETSMNTDYLLLLTGLLAGDGGVLGLIAQRYMIKATEELGRFSELDPFKPVQSS
jgi:hypothetical protein